MFNNNKNTKHYLLFLYTALTCSFLHATQTLILKRAFSSNFKLSNRKLFFLSTNVGGKTKVYLTTRRCRNVKYLFSIFSYDLYLFIASIYVNQIRQGKTNTMLHEKKKIKPNVLGNLKSWQLFTSAWFPFQKPHNSQLTVTFYFNVMSWDEDCYTQDFSLCRLIWNYRKMTICNREWFGIIVIVDIVIYGLLSCLIQFYQYFVCSAYFVTKLNFPYVTNRNKISKSF